MEMEAPSGPEGEVVPLILPVLKKATLSTSAAHMLKLRKKSLYCEVYTCAAQPEIYFRQYSECLES